MTATGIKVRGPSSLVTRLSRVRVTRRGLQISLGVIWLLDGILQFQSYMYSQAFVHGVLAAGGAGQPSFIGDPIRTFASFYGHDITLWNTLAAETQCAIGLGLILSRRTVRAALLISFGWAFVVWWFGEGFGPLVNGDPVSPLMGAPGAALVYGLIGALLWPRRGHDEQEAVDGGLFGSHGGQLVWAVLWLEAGVLWFLNVNRSASAIHDQIVSMASGSPSWLAGALSSAASAAQGHGALIATVLGIVSILIALAVWTRLRIVALAIGIVLSLAYWIFGQSLGGPFWAGSATDVNSAPLFVLLAFTLVAQPLPRRVAAGSSLRNDEMMATA
jgi:hypothetical protein